MVRQRGGVRRNKGRQKHRNAKTLGHHHEFPGSLSQLRAIAPEFYNNLYGHNSYVKQPRRAWAKPCAGVGINLTWLYSVDLPNNLNLSRISVGPAFQLGSDFMLTERTFINIDVKKILIATDVGPLGGATLDTVHINPWIYGIGIGFKI
ncbi:MAG: OmpW family outer membrane protein [Oligoflexia bacterium]|nr:OmpW family outer membrane protein [Oligoflexia bacterium]